MTSLFTNWLLLMAICTLPGIAFGADNTDVQGDFLIKFKPGRVQFAEQLSTLAVGGRGATEAGQLELLDDQWVHLKVAPVQLSAFSTKSFMETMKANPDVEFIQPNYKIGFIEDYKTEDVGLRRMAQDALDGRIVQALMPPTLSGSSFNWGSPAAVKDPEIPLSITTKAGADPYVNSQWGMKSIHAPEAWKKITGNRKVIVAVLDSGVDYTHEDLAGSLWHNPREIPNNNIDDDRNGFIDDVVGWDFVQNDNKPYDITSSTWGLLLTGGNPGHGTHCAGTIGAAANNSKGIAGVAPQASIMVVRFLDNRGSGDTARAIKAINYAVANGAKILSNSWGSEGEHPEENNQAMKDTIMNAMKHDVLFIAAAGNGHRGKGYDNDTDAKPAVPASYNIPNIISVAAIDPANKLGKFSNWGKKTVHFAAPGVGIFSTMVGNRYSDNVVNLGIKMKWEGTSMAAPYVAGAAALVWAMHPEYKAADVKAALIRSAEKIPDLETKLVSGGKINVEAAIR